mgnify:CR=1 FL=1
MFFGSFVDWFGDVIVVIHQVIFDNQINNVLAFPGIFKGALRARAKRITEAMKLAAVYAIADCVSADELQPSVVIPSIFHPEVSNQVADAVEKAWLDHKS